MGVYIWKEGAEEYNLADIASQSVNPPSDEIKTVTITFDDTEPTWKSLTVNGGNILLSVAQSTLNTIIVLGWDNVDLSQYGQSSSHTRGTVSYDFVQHTYSIDIIATIDGVDVPYQRNNAPLAGYISTIDSRDMTSSITLSGNIKIEAIPEQLDLKNAYIGEYQEGWQPGANTLIYYDFETANGSNVPNLGTLGSTYDGVATGVTFSTLTSGKKVANYTSKTRTNGIVTSATMNAPSEFTIAFWINGPSSNTGRTGCFGGSSSSAELDIQFNAVGKIDTFVYNNGWIWEGKNDTTVLDGNWHFICWTYDSTNKYTFSLDNSNLTFTAVEGNINNAPNVNGFYVKVGNTGNSSYDWSWIGQVGCFIIENKARTAQEKLNYYNQTKSLYGIS